MGSRDGVERWRMEWLKPIEEIENEFRRQGTFLLADINSRKLWFFGYKDQATINKMMDSMKGRCNEMVNFLIARAKG